MECGIDQKGLLKSGAKVSLQNESGKYLLFIQALEELI